jgi:RND family efflux transporter MFP subunit
VTGTIVYLGKKPPAKAMVFPPPVVSVTSPELRDMCDLYDFTGRTDAIEIADVRARVEGFLQNIVYKDGTKVKRGDLLFEIDPAQYQAKRDELAAQLLSAKAVLARSEIDLERVEKAVQADAVSREEVTQRKANRDIAAAAVKAAEASLAEADLQLGYTKALAPINGVVSRNLVDVGSLVGAQDKTLLATVTQMDPMNVYFNVSEELLLGSLQEIRKKMGTLIEVGTGSGQDTRYNYRGKIDYIDSKVDSGTGTVEVRGVVENPSGTLLPGMFVRVRVPAGECTARTLIDERAVRRDLNGTYILIVDKDAVVLQRYVTLGMEIDGMREVKPYKQEKNGLATGIQPEEKYVVLGVLSARPGSKVTPIPLGMVLGQPAPTGTQPATQKSSSAGK